MNKLLMLFDPSVFCYVKSGGTSFIKEIKNVIIIIECFELLLLRSQGICCEG